MEDTMQYPKKFLMAILTLVLTLPAAAWAAPQVNMVIAAEKEVVVEENGKKVAKLVPAETVTAGETVTYTISYVNTGDEVATKVAIVDPIPTGMVYIPGSASNEANVSFSIDQGATYKKPSLLTYEVKNPDGKTEKRIASPEQYTHIRWEVPAIAPGEKGKLSFKVRMQ
jgi:uncharacterized repeat protein (TIGR01451 family)